MSLVAELRKVIPAVPRLKRFTRPGGDDAWGFEMPARRYAETWMALWKARRATGHYPLLASSPRYNADDDGNQVMFRKNPYARVLRRGLRLSPEAFLRTRQLDSAEILRDPEYRGPWPSKKTVPRKFTSGNLEVARIRGLKTIWILLLPVSESWEAMAFHFWGGWNDAPAPEAQVCMLKSWNDRFGAEFVSDGGDFIELYCARPPLTRKEALTLTEEMFTYCVDIVDQGCGTVEALAHEILGSRTWFFWWD